MTRIGVLSDTHGLLDKRVFEHFKDVDEIWHAGDIGSEEVLRRLRANSSNWASSSTKVGKRRFIPRGETPPRI